MLFFLQSDPTIPIVKIHDDIMNEYEIQYASTEMWEEIIEALGSEDSWHQRL